MSLESLAKLPAKSIRAVFTDLDDTLTENGQIDSPTFEALCRLKARGYWVTLVSGRPAGWADALMRLWPLDAMVFENGAGVLIREPEKTRVVNLAEGTSRESQRKRLEQIFQELKAQIPHLKLASDQPYRLFDYAIDFTEDPPRLSGEELEIVLAHLEKQKDVTFKLSSIHVNYWFGSHTKVTACRHLLGGPLKALGIARDNVLYCGDSPNDEPLFEFFEHSMGVANVAKFLPRMKSPPRYLAKKPNGSGFQEVVARLLST
jgi:HAD superfamily hydrolase (TIGR01484 family)